MSGRVIVLGSINIDTLWRVERFAQAGETLAGPAPTVGLGGKGANQAIAAARAGARVRFVAPLGTTDRALVTETLAAEGIAPSLIDCPDHPTGSATVLVDAAGQSIVYLATGTANDGLAVGPALAALGTLAPGDVLVAQGETPLGVTRAAFAAARAAGAITVWNAAPVPPPGPGPEAGPDPADIVWLIVNEVEAAQLARAADPDTPEEAAEIAHHLATHGWGGGIVVTLGHRGLVLWESGRARHLPAFPARALDTTAAGDTLVGVVAASLAGGAGIETALVQGAAAAAVTVERPGAAPSIARAAETQARVAAAGAPIWREL